MFAHLTLAVRDRIIRELRGYWADHPRYEGFSNNIQGKYSFDERPQFGMVVRTNGASNVVLSPDNFIGTIEGYVYLANTPEKRTSRSIEWAKEDAYVPPEKGVYKVKVFNAPDIPIVGQQYDVYVHKHERKFESSPFFSAPNEITLFDTPMDNSLRLIEYPSNRILTSSEYTLNGQIVTLAEPVPRGLSISARYTIDIGQRGPYRVFPSEARRDIIGGVVLAFGTRMADKDEQFIVVSEDREEVSQEYGGRWEVSVDLEIIARDVHSQADIADKTVLWIWSTLRPHLTNLGIDIQDVSLGGEAEEVYDENGDDYFYTASISFTVQTNWFVHFPLVVPILGNNTPYTLVTSTEPLVGLGKGNLIQRVL
jgi:hypothetical protein